MNTDIAFRRVRAANPVQAVTPADADALFERITATAPEPLRRRSRRRRPLIVVAVALVLAAVLASTAPAISSWIGDIIGPAEVNSEFVQAQKQLSIPPGYSWPKPNFPTDSVTSRGGGGAYAVNIAQAAWECYWAQEIKRGNVANQRRAHAALSDLLANNIMVAPEGASENYTPPQSATTPTAVYANDGGVQFKQRMYTAAAVGHPQLLEQSCRANAPPGW